MLTKASLFVCAAAALVSICQSIPSQPSIPVPLASPCPELFRYEAVDNQGYWTGNLILRSDYDLKGVWIRLIFDKEVKDLTVDHKFIIKHVNEDRKLVKLQSPDLVSVANTPEILKINVTYDGTEIPSLIEYRLNARTICPQANYNRFDTFRGDAKSDYFLPALQAKHDIIPLKYQCGVPYPTNQYPWQASLYTIVNKEEKYSCEAILISPSYLITAAHCVTFVNDRTVIPRAFVTTYLGSDGASKDAVKSLVQGIIVHPGYKAGSLTDDIAILKLVNPVDITKDLRPICLGTQSEHDDKVVITGYEIGKDGNVGKLLESNVFRTNHQECLTLSPQLQDVLTYDTYCVSYKSDDKNCVGDSGSGLISIANGKATLRGLVALGVKLQNKNGCDDKTNVVVTDIHRYLSWIDNVIY